MSCRYATIFETSCFGWFEIGRWNFNWHNKHTNKQMKITHTNRKWGGKVATKGMSTWAEDEYSFFCNEKCLFEYKTSQQMAFRLTFFDFLGIWLRSAPHWLFVSISMPFLLNCCFLFLAFALFLCLWIDRYVCVYEGVSLCVKIPVELNWAIERRHSLQSTQNKMEFPGWNELTIAAFFFSKVNQMTRRRGGGEGGMLCTWHHLTFDVIWCCCRSRLRRYIVSLWMRNGEKWDARGLSFWNFVSKCYNSNQNRENYLKWRICLYFSSLARFKSMCS